MKFRIATILTLAAVLSVSPSLAQGPVKPPPTNAEKAGGANRSDPCAQGSATVGAGNQMVTPNVQNGDQTLSDHLAKSGGVICPPPGVDPEIRQPTPQTGNMPVIPPPGTPGGDQSVQPK